MKHELLKSVIYDMHEVIRHTEIVARDYSFSNPTNYIVVGIRRSGKSTLLYHQAKYFIQQGISWEQIIYINFEDERLSEFTAHDFNDIVLTAAEMSPSRPVYFFDEIQNIDGWERFARRMADGGNRVYITGSNAKMLSSEMETRLGGRYLTSEVFPFAFNEYLRAMNIPYNDRALHTTKALGRIQGAAMTYLKDGGFPESIHYLLKREYTENIYKKILLGDIAARHNIRNADAFRILIKKIAETVMHEVSYSKLHGILKTIGVKLSKDTIITYIGYAEDAYLIFRLSNYVAAFADKETTPKYYFSENALLNLFLINKETALLENIVAVHLYRQYKSSVFYYKSAKTDIDIDFYIPEQALMIQVAYSVSDSIVRERELKSIVRFARQSREELRYLLVTAEEEEDICEEDVHIQVIPLYKFLLVSLSAPQN